jgi:chromate transporter
MQKSHWTAFLKDVFVCSLGGYGGPEAHICVLIDQLVTKKRHLSEEELIELVALCSILPGPTSTQAIVAVGYKVGGPVLGLLTMLVWALPVLILMTLLSFLYQILAQYQIAAEGLRYIGPMAVGFIIVAAWKIGRKVATDRLTILLMLMGAVITYFFHLPWVFPLVLIAGGAAAVLAAPEKVAWNSVRLNPPWRYLGAFALIAVVSVVMTLTWDNLIVHLFESFYRYGYLVFGGGQVVVPVMYSEMVDIRRYLNNQEFLTGYGLVQGLPGPMFSFSAYVGGMAARGNGAVVQTIGAAISGIGIFLPGLLLIYFIYPIWENFKKIKGIKVALKGINAVAGGMIAVAAVILMQKSGLTIENLLVTVLTVILLSFKKIPVPLIVLLALVAGFVV